MTTPTPAPAPAAATAGTRRSRWWVAALTFVVGLGVGVVLVGLLSAGSSEFPLTAGSSAGTPTGPGASPLPGAGVQATVNDACLRVINEAQDTYGALDGVGQAAADLDAARLDEIVRELQPLQTRLQRDLGACRVLTRLSDGTTSTSTPPASPPATSPGARAPSSSAG